MGLEIFKKFSFDNQWSDMGDYDTIANRLLYESIKSRNVTIFEIVSDIVEKPDLWIILKAVCRIGDLNALKVFFNDSTSPAVFNPFQVTSKNEFEYSNLDEESILKLAKGGHIEILEWISNNGISNDLFQKDSTDETKLSVNTYLANACLVNAAKSENTPTIEFFLKLGAINLHDAIMAAIDQDNWELARWLKKKRHMVEEYYNLRDDDYFLKRMKVE
jgi:hypothetical protein